MTRRAWVWIALACAVAVTPARAMANGEPPPSPVALALVAQMTLDEKLAMVHGTFDPDPTQGEAGYLPGVPRLGVPPLRLTDGPAGVRVLTPTTAMPAPISLAASFSRTNALDYGAVLGRDARARNQDVLLGPMMNLVRVPQAGRNFETLGEDPFLMSELVAPEVRGIQSQGTIATAKHFAENNQEADRQSVDVNVDEQTLHEMELPAFQAAINAGVGAVMCAYSKVNGTYSCSNATLLTDILRDQWGFGGFVMSDWIATHAATDLTAGLDLSMPGYWQPFFDADLRAAIAAGTIPEAALDHAVARILTVLERFGLLVASPPPRPTIDVLADADVARRVAEDGAVLLRNERGVLPLDAGAVLSLAVIGPTARSLLVGGRGSAHVVGFTEREQSPLDALIEQAGSGASIRFAVGDDLDGVVVPGETLTPDGGAPGDHGLLRTTSGSATQVDPTVDFTGAAALTGPPGTSWTWTGSIIAPASGDYDLRLQATGGGAPDPSTPAAGRSVASMSVDGTPIASITSFFGLSMSLIRTADGLTNAGTVLHLEAGQPHAISITGNAGDTPLSIRLAWITPELRQARIDEAVAVARSSHTAVVFAYNEGSEGVDRTSLALPGPQDELIAAVAAANPRTIVVLNTGDPVTMPWAGDVAGILEMWYPGQEGGGATASVLLGTAEPGGRLPETFPVSEDDPPTAASPERYPGVDGEEQYSEGIFVGYRWYDAQDIAPLFPFGHGLSYTRFSYSGLSVSPGLDGGLDVSFVVSNTGQRAGVAVPQVYLGAGGAPAGVQMAERALVGFARLELRPGDACLVRVHVGRPQLSYWSPAEHRWVVASGERSIDVGASSRDLRLHTDVTIGLTTTTVTIGLTTTTSTTTLPAGCADAVTLAAVACRLDELRDRVDALVPEGKIRTKLDAKLNAAKAKIRKAVGLVGQGKTKPAGKAVQRALGAVRGFRRRVRSKGAGKVIVPDAVPTLVGAADRLLGDLATLRREIGSS
jgi:beta-glucosidase